MKEMIEIEKLKFPIGPFVKPNPLSSDQIEEWIFEIEQFPAKLKELVEDLSKDQINWRYRPGGWMIKQVVHHCADSHMNSFIRFKLALTEDYPTIKPYLEHLWANLPDGLTDSVSESISILDGLHARWCTLLKSLDTDDMNRKFVHPEHGTEFSLMEMIGFYAWHGNHHLAHIQQAIEMKGSFN